MLMTPRTADVIAVAFTILIYKRRHVTCAPATTQEASYLTNGCLGRIFRKYPIDSLFDKRLSGMLGWQVHHWEAYLASSCLESLFGKCIVGKPMPDVVASSKAKKDTKNTQKLMPKCRIWKPKCLKIASWSPILFPSRFWSQNGTTTLVHPNHFLRFWLPQGGPKTAKIH